MDALYDPEVIRIQPRPLKSSVVHYGGDGAGECLTAIHRRFAPGDVPRCGLCPTCDADRDGECHLIVNAHVTRSDAALFDLGRWLGVAPAAGESPDLDAGRPGVVMAQDDLERDVLDDQPHVLRLAGPGVADDRQLPEAGRRLAE